MKIPSDGILMQQKPRQIGVHRVWPRGLRSSGRNCLLRMQPPTPSFTVMHIRILRIHTEWTRPPGRWNDCCSRMAALERELSSNRSAFRVGSPGGSWDAWVARCLVSNFVLSNSPYKVFVFLFFFFAIFAISRYRSLLNDGEYGASWRSPLNYGECYFSMANDGVRHFL